MKQSHHRWDFILVSLSRLLTSRLIKDKGRNWRKRWKKEYEQNPRGDPPLKVCLEQKCEKIFCSGLSKKKERARKGGEKRVAEDRILEERVQNLESTLYNLAVVLKTMFGKFMVHQRTQNCMLEKFEAQQHNQNSDIMLDIAIRNKFFTRSIKNHRSPTIYEITNILKYFSFYHINNIATLEDTLALLFIEQV